MSYCINCGTKLSDGVRFCTGCGTPVPSAEATEVSQPQQETKVEQPQAVPVETTPVQPQPAPAPTYVAPAPVQQPVQQPVQPQPAPIQQPAPAPTYAAPTQVQQPAYAPAPATVQGVETPPSADSRYAPVSTGGFIGIFLLMLLPIVNFILLIVWACGGCRKVNQSNLAKAMLVLMLIGIVLSVLIMLVGGLFLGSMGGLDGIKDSIINKAMEAAGE